MKAPEVSRSARALLVCGLAGWFLVAPLAAHAAGVTAAAGLGAGSTLWLEGTSTLHDYHSRTSTLGFVLLRDEAQADPADAAALRQWLRDGGLRGLELSVPLKTMRSGKEALDKNMLKALKATEYPDIRFVMSNSRVAAARGDTLPVTAEGTLSVAGQQRPVSVTGTLVPTEQGVWLEGSHPMKMSEFGVKPPALMLGTLKVRDPIVVRFKLLIVPRDAKAQQSAAHP
ncbi:MAG: YceI family protein [Candidatus Eisenbacteria bacterium]|nr:YceI family protein [Candidatus Eisenbacteria bacterium]